jgi:pyruvate/2-oxoglutarate dehydrogenase complex dihydrolipoamide dehydrogenase (E3) component
MTDVIVISAGPAGVLAALRAVELGARTMLVASGEFGGMAANNGPILVQALAHAARLIRDARQLSQYGSRSARRCWIIPACWRACARSSTMSVRILPCTSSSIPWG